jgi:hypothetical protein
MDDRLEPVQGRLMKMVRNVCELNRPTMEFTSDDTFRRVGLLGSALTGLDMVLKEYDQTVAFYEKEGEA